MGIIYLTVDHVLELHEQVLTLGGPQGLRSAHLLASAVFQAQQSAFGEDAYQTIAEDARGRRFESGHSHQKFHKVGTPIRSSAVNTRRAFTAGYSLTRGECGPRAVRSRGYRSLVDLRRVDDAHR